jgi:hypothetical protein
MPVSAVARATNTAPRNSLRLLFPSLNIDTSKDALRRAGSIRAYRTNVLSGILASCPEGVVGSWTDGPPTQELEGQVTGGNSITLCFADTGQQASDSAEAVIEQGTSTSSTLQEGVTAGPVVTGPTYVIKEAKTGSGHAGTIRKGCNKWLRQRRSEPVIFLQMLTNGGVA